MSQSEYDWAVIGAGPAGIAAVGKLLDHRVDPKKLLWIDPAFKVGDFGEKWCYVPSNTQVSLFLQFLHACKSFHFIEVQHDFEITNLEINDTCELRYMAEPLMWVTQRLQQQVDHQIGHVKSLYMHNHAWQIKLDDDNELRAKQVICAVGSEPKSLEYDNIEVIHFDIAMNPVKLASTCDAGDHVAVFGSSHSAVLAMRNLVHAGVTKITNFYHSPLRYAVYLDDWIMYDDSGLKGTTADWAHQYLNTDTLPGLHRYYASDEQVACYLPDCNKVIYAVGFERRHHIEVQGMPAITYDRRNGVIAAGLFGFGIAFPEFFTTPLGHSMPRVGLWKFMDYLNRMMPLWQKYTV